MNQDLNQDQGGTVRWTAKLLLLKIKGVENQDVNQDQGGTVPCTVKINFKEI